MFTATSKLILKEFDKHGDLTAKQIASAENTEPELATLKALEEQIEATKADFQAAKQE